MHPSISADCVSPAEWPQAHRQNVPEGGGRHQRAEFQGADVPALLLLVSVQRAGGVPREQGDFNPGGTPHFPPSPVISTPEKHHISHPFLPPVAKPPFPPRRARKLTSRPPRLLLGPPPRVRGMTYPTSTAWYATAVLNRQRYESTQMAPRRRL